MKVYLGPYRGRFIGKTRRFLLNVCPDSIYDTKFMDIVFKFLNYLEGKIDGKFEYVHIDDYDTWSADSTLAVIIHPLLLKLKESRYGYPIVSKEDAPAELKDEARWNYILDKMIYSFSVIKEDNTYSYDLDIQEGLNLFGKYYRTLWT